MNGEDARLAVDKVVDRDASPTSTVAEPGAGSALKTRWYSVHDAAKVLGISEASVRKRIADRSLTALRAGRGYRILLAGDPPRLRPRSAELVPQAATQGVDIEALAALVRDLQQQSLALAGQIGYLQSQLAQAHERLALADSPVEGEPAPEGESDTVSEAVSMETHRAALDQIEELKRVVAIYQRASAPPIAAAPGRWRWRFWRKT